MQPCGKRIPSRPDFWGFTRACWSIRSFFTSPPLFLAVTALVLVLSVRYLEIAGEKRGAYYALLLFACVGMMLMVSGVDRIAMFLRSGGDGA